MSQDRTMSDSFRTRLFEMAIISVGLVFGSVLAFALFELTQSRVVALSAAAVCGGGTERAMNRFRPFGGASPTTSEKAIWIVLFGPAIIVLFGILIWEWRQSQELTLDSVLIVMLLVLGLSLSIRLLRMNRSQETYS